MSNQTEPYSNVDHQKYGIPPHRSGAGRYVIPLRQKPCPRPPHRNKPSPNHPPEGCQVPWSHPPEGCQVPWSHPPEGGGVCRRRCFGRGYNVHIGLTLSKRGTRTSLDPGSKTHVDDGVAYWRFRLVRGSVHSRLAASN